MASCGNAALAVPEAADSLAQGVTAAVIEFVRKLRWLGLEVSTAELADAMRAVSSADLLDREQLRGRLQITLVKRAADIPVFDGAFDLLFPVLASPPTPDGQAGDGAAGIAPAASRQAAPELLERLVSQLRGDPGADVSDLAAAVVSAFGGLDDGPVAGTQRYYEYRIMRQLDLSALLRRAMRLDGEAPRTGLDRPLASGELQQRLQELRAQIAAELRGRLAGRQGPDSLLGRLRESVLDEEFLRAGPAELEAMRAVVRPLARRIATTARRRRRMNKSGSLDVRRTMRRAVSTGGVPIDPAWRERRRPRPRLVVLCDVSGSVSEFAKFTLSLLSALHAELPRLRSYVFADGIAEVTDLVESSPGVIDTRLLLSRPGVVRGDGHSDYGSVLSQFVERHSSPLSHDSVLIICGDARTNYRPERADLLRALRGRVRAIHWLNPEAADDWDAGDSRIGAYQSYCDSVTEVRTLRQLGAWADRLMQAR